jgi:hypothetical protein
MTASLPLAAPGHIRASTQPGTPRYLVTAKYVTGVAGQFEAGLRSALLAHDPGGRYQETISFYYLLAVSPGRPGSADR